MQLRKCVTLDPCKMTSYDADKDGVIKWEEVEDILNFSHSELIIVLFMDADANRGKKC